jgi:hypothetical protein
MWHASLDASRAELGGACFRAIKREALPNRAPVPRRLEAEAPW